MIWEMKPTRDAFGEALVELSRENKKIIVLSGDLEDATRTEYFKKEFPERFFNLGISEQDILGTAVGLSHLPAHSRRFLLIALMEFYASLFVTIGEMSR
jgi:transketolase